MAKNRPNVIPIIEDARHPQKYRMLVPMVDAVFADVAQPDQVCCTNAHRRVFDLCCFMHKDAKQQLASFSFIGGIAEFDNSADINIKRQ